MTEEIRELSTPAARRLRGPRRSGLDMDGPATEDGGPEARRSDELGVAWNLFGELHLRRRVPMHRLVVSMARGQGLLRCHVRLPRRLRRDRWNHGRGSLGRSP